MGNDLGRGEGRKVEKRREAGEGGRRRGVANARRSGAVGAVPWRVVNSRTAGLANIGSDCQTGVRETVSLD